MSESNNIFLTGITGTLGKELIKELYLTTKSNFFILVRSDKKKTYIERADKLLKDAGLDSEPGNRITVFEGDVATESYGLSDQDCDTLRQKVDKFFHIAALTNLNGGEEDCKRINVGGGLNTLKLATDLHNNGKLKNLFYFSTAYVAGSLQTYLSYEDGLPEKPAHANFYESSKYEAETHVRKAIKNGLPVTIFRPSIVVGHSKTGVVSEFNVVYPFVRLFVHGMLTKIVTRVENTINIVPIDFVIKATCEIIKNDDIVGKTFHLSTPEPPTIGMVLRIPEEEADVKFPEYTIIDPDDYNEADFTEDELFVYKSLKPYTGYLNGNLDFDMTNTRNILKGTDVPLPVTDYNFIKVLYKYAVDVGYFKLPTL